MLNAFFVMADVENQESIEPCNLIMTRYERTPMQPWMLSSNLDSNLLKKRRMCSKTVRSGVTATKQDSGIIAVPIRVTQLQCVAFE